MNRSLGRGPSPRGWGNRWRNGCQTGPGRAIPTWVGKSTASGAGFCAASGHPHVGGEIRYSPNDSQRAPGPSPRGWGNRIVEDVQISIKRAIPTWVGKSQHRWQGLPAMPGHPHVGGEIGRRGFWRPMFCGPSPRGWGNPRSQSGSRHWRRAIPTWVGKSARRWARGHKRSGHPHVGGEILSIPERFRLMFGPSPRGWGNPSSSVSRPRSPRAIPTWVGKSFPSPSMILAPSGHPHVGGEIRA